MNHAHVSLQEIERFKDCADRGLYYDFEYPAEETTERLNDLERSAFSMARKILPNPSLPVHVRLMAGYRRFAIAFWIIFPGEKPHKSESRCADFLGIELAYYLDLKTALMEILGCKGPDPEWPGAFGPEIEPIRRILGRLVICGKIRGTRFWLAGYRRFVVALWTVNADIFGGAEIDAIAEELKISAKSVYKIRERLTGN